MPASSSKLVLIALSDNGLAEALSDECKKRGLRVVSVEDGNQALAKMKALKPDLFVVDIVLPGMDGYDVLSAKSFDKDLVKIPSFVVSNLGIPVDMKRLPASGIREYYIRTHVDVAEVAGRVCDVLGCAAAPGPSAATKNGAKKVLWVEDDKFLSDILSKKFTGLGYNLLKANSGDEALSILEKETPDIVMLDILLPGVNGFDILQKIRMQDRFRGTPVIMLSNLSAASDVDKAKKLGAQSFIVKAAVSLDQIVREVEKLIK